LKPVSGKPDCGAETGLPALDATHSGLDRLLVESEGEMKLGKETCLAVLALVAL